MLYFLKNVAAMDGLFLLLREPVIRWGRVVRELSRHAEGLSIKAGKKKVDSAPFGTACAASYLEWLVGPDPRPAVNLTSRLPHC